MPTTAITLNVLRDRSAIEQIIASLDPSSPLRKHLERLLAAGRDTAGPAQLIGVAEGWILRMYPRGGHSVYHFFDTRGGANQIISEAAALALAGGTL